MSESKYDRKAAENGGQEKTYLRFGQLFNEVDFCVIENIIEDIYLRVVMNTFHFEWFEEEARGISFIETANFGEIYWSLKKKQSVQNEMQI